MSSATSIALPSYFIAYSALMVPLFVIDGLVGIDARIYSAAARAWIDGADPWATAVGGYFFAAPPPTLLPFAPFAFLGEWPSAVIWVSGSAAVALVVVRQLRLKWWWALFPPVTNGILAGNPDVLIVALVLARNEVLGTLAAFLKIYSLVPIFGERQWRTLVAASVALLVTVPFLPWSLYLGQVEDIAATLEAQAFGLSAYGTWWVVALTGIALVSTGLRMAGWLAVPALWPSTQLHYSALALPALALARGYPVALLVAAILLSWQAAWLPPTAVVILAIAVLERRIRPRQPQGLRVRKSSSPLDDSVSHQRR